MTACIGHNSAAYGLASPDKEVETILHDDHKKLFYYAKWHIADYITGTQGMNLEHEGAYIRFLVRLYDRGKPFPDDDRFMATVMGVGLRVWRRIRAALISVGKIVCRNGALTNSRFEQERKKRAEELRRQAEAARKRWERERQNKKVSAKFQQSLPEVCSKVPANINKKVNEINGSDVTTHMPTRDYRLESRYKDIESSGSKDPKDSCHSGQLSLSAEDDKKPKGMKPAEAARMAMDRYNSIARDLGLPRALKMTPARQTKIVARIREAGGWSGFEQALANLEKSAFLQGHNDHGWKADFDFICQAKSFSRLFDGGYGNGSLAKPVPQKPPGMPDAIWDDILEKRRARGEL